MVPFSPSEVRILKEIIMRRGNKEVDGGVFLLLLTKLNYDAITIFRDSYIFDTVCDERFEPVNLGWR